MLGALKDLITVLAAAVLLAYSTGQQDWLWTQIAAIRHGAIIEARRDWGCPSIFNKSACKQSHYSAGVSQKIRQKSQTVNRSASPP